MDVSSLTVKIIVLLLPGIVAALLVEKITVHKAWGQFRFLLYSIVLGAISYAILSVVVDIYNLSVSTRYHVTLTFWQSLFSTTQAVNPLEVIFSVVTSILIAVLASVAITKNWVIRVARMAKFTEKYGDESLYYFSLNSPEISWVWVKLAEEGLLYEGWRESFSEDANVREILLRSVKVYRLEDSQYLYDLPAVYLSMARNKVIIEIPKLN